MTETASRRVIMERYVCDAHSGSIPGARNISSQDTTLVGELMWASYRAIDDGSDARPRMMEEAKAFGAGQCGAPLWSLSYGVELNSKLVSAVLVCVESEAPFLASVITDPGWRRQRLAETLIQMTMYAAKEAGYARVRLVVRTDNTPGMHLFEKLGFRRA